MNSRSYCLKIVSNISWNQMLCTSWCVSKENTNTYPMSADFYPWSLVVQRDGSDGVGGARTDAAAGQRERFVEPAVEGAPQEESERGRGRCRRSLRLGTGRLVAMFAHLRRRDAEPGVALPRSQDQPRGAAQTLSALVRRADHRHATLQHLQVRTLRHNSN